jgi:sugar fermentation stimulation protein A
MVTQGHRAIMLYLVQRTDCDRFGLAADIDAAYAAAFETAQAKGVERLVYGTQISPDGVWVDTTRFGDFNLPG